MITQSQLNRPFKIALFKAHISFVDNHCKKIILTYSITKFFVILRYQTFYMRKMLVFAVLIVAMLSSCDRSPAVFNVTTKNFNKNAVINIFSPETGEVFKVENIINGSQTFKINLPKKGYAALTAQDGETLRKYWFYLDGGDYDVILDANNNKSYPFKKVPSKEGAEFVDFYKIKDALSLNLVDSLDNAQHEMDKSTRENVDEKAQKLDKWLEREGLLELTIIKEFSKKYPNSPHTLFLLDQLGRVDTDTETYVTIFNGLSNDLKESKAGKNMLEQITRSSRMMAGSKMPEIEGQSPNGKPFDLKILKKINLVIVWTSYNTKSRENNLFLKDLYEKFKNEDVEFIGVSLDQKRNWWLNVIRDDKLTWPQFSDLKGAKSSNAKNLSDYNIPYYFLIDKQGKVLMNNHLTTDFISDEIRHRL